MIECPEYDCGLKFPSQEEVNAHLQWDHNRSEHRSNILLGTIDNEGES